MKKKNIITAGSHPERILACVLGFVLVIVIVPSCSGDWGDRDFRQDMRDFVNDIGEYARETDPDFIVIPQNGQELATTNGESDGSAADAYLAAIDGQGREDLFYGYDDDNQATDSSDTEWMLPFLEIQEDAGVQVLVTDYCWDQSLMDASYAANADYDFTSFAADSRDLDTIPDYPTEPYNRNSDDIQTLSDAANFLYLLDPGNFAGRSAYLAALAATEYDFFIIDFFFEDDSGVQVALTADEVAALKTKPQGGTRLVICYLSIGEAEDYRYYWKDTWEDSPPEWLEEENPAWEGNYKVRYWEESWQDVIFGSEDAYLDRIMAAGFDGVYLDIIDAFEYFE